MLNSTEKTSFSHREHRDHTEIAELNQLTQTVIGCAITVHKELGAGLLESVYRQCLAHEIKKLDLLAEQEVSVPLEYDGLFFETAYRADILVNRTLLIEIKNVEKINDVHKAQTLTYTKILNYPIGLLINFHETLLKNGIHRFINTNINSVDSV